MGIRSKGRNRATFRRNKQRRNRLSVANGGYVNQSRKITTFNIDAGVAKSFIQPIYEIGAELAPAAQLPQISAIGDMLIKFDSLTAKLKSTYQPSSNHILPPYEVGIVLITTPQVLTLYNNYTSTTYQDLDQMILAIMSGASAAVPFAYKHAQAIPHLTSFDSSAYQWGTANKVWHIPRPYVTSNEATMAPRRYQYICVWAVWAGAAYNDFINGSLELVEKLRIVNQKQATILKELH